MTTASKRAGVSAWELKTGVKPLHHNGTISRMGGTKSKADAGLKTSRVPEKTFFFLGGKIGLWNPLPMTSG